eukprot:Opistho-2@86580
MNRLAIIEGHLSHSQHPTSTHSAAQANTPSAPTASRVEMAGAARALGKIAAGSTCFFLCDMQEAFRPSIKYYPEIIAVAQRMLSASHSLKVPTIVTEQYPKGLGKTVSELDVTGIPVFSKTKFSMLTNEVLDKMKDLAEVKSVVLFGIESHVCVLQTCMDLLGHGFDVHILVDGVSSRSMIDRGVALERMKQSGAFLTTSESLLFQLMGDARHPGFKDIQSLVKSPYPQIPLFP